MADLLLELFSEEIPAIMQNKACDDLNNIITNGLVEAGLTYRSSKALSTPRRLCFMIEGLIDKSPNTREERKGPRVDAPEQALNGFLRGAGLTLDQLEIRDDKKGKTYFAVIEKEGRFADEIASEVITNTINNFPWAKSMRWGSGSMKWVRPLHSILCILSSEDGVKTVNIEVDGITSSNMTSGHRFMSPAKFAVHSIEQYQKDLKKASVILDAQERADHILEDAKNLAFAQGLELVEDTSLLKEVAGLVEYPVVLMGEISKDFFDLPSEVLITSMKEHQKFFSVKNPKTNRIEKFITVANRTTADNGKTIIAGNQKVLFARLSDAKFFWENDLRIAKSGMNEWSEKLEKVTFHNKLGSQSGRIKRISLLACEASKLSNADEELSKRAATLCKVDLSSEMVGEFAKLQGLMGCYYIAEAGLPNEIGAASKDHYSPQGPTDIVPTAPVSIAVALADKIDTLTGFWSIDEKPTGSKDPFALRRSALGVIRLVIDNEINDSIDRILAYGFYLNSISIQSLDNKSQTKYVELKDNSVDQILNMIDESQSLKIKDILKDLISFFHDRLKVYLRDKNIDHDVIDACLAMPNNTNFSLLTKRAKVLQDFCNSDDGKNLLQGFKRANNILAAEEKKDGVSYEGIPELKYAQIDEERSLFKILDKNETRIIDYINKQDFKSAMNTLAKLRSPIDLFFENVQINSDSKIVRRNRLCLLNRIRLIMKSVADFSFIEN